MLCLGSPLKISSCLIRCSRPTTFFLGPRHAEKVNTDQKGYWVAWKSIRVFVKMKEKSSAFKSAKLHQQQHNGDVAPFSFNKLLDPQASWDKDQLGDVLHWIRQAVALICGLIWGVIPLVGAIWIFIFLLLSSGIVYVYYALVLKVDEEEFGGHSTLLQEGMFASITLFLLSWIMVYSLLHF